MLFYLLLGLLCLSSAVNIALLFYLSKKQIFKKHDPTNDLRAFVADLATGPAIVKIEYIDRSEILLRSPRHL